ncbi:unnamed protein product [Ceutorhynchus assimilis]|uniref:Motile sperm domain-containing protein 2 n=1 Tax=Ceutorhynchus assimilis TaxID=467358 RepID=A0A9N9MV45_9CUCU|nr:unnamed protein product [Ceutorhynchus assimilis]
MATEPAVAAVPQNLVDQLRSSFLKEVEAKGPSSVHPKDLERVKSDDKYLKRFIAHNDNDIGATLKMMWTSLNWRKDFQTNDINENNIKMDIIIKGAFFPHGKDIDGRDILIFKTKMHSKGVVDAEDLKRCVIYWFERLERMTDGNPISIFFDVEGCGLGNMDMEFIRYLINLFKEYYPYFLNYIIIYEMPWVLSAAFKIIKSWLPEKAIEKLKMVSKKNVFTYVPKTEALQCWGGDSNYVFSFIPEEPQKAEKSVAESNNVSVKKVHFMDGSPMSEQAPSAEPKEGKCSILDGPLAVSPTSIITFVKEGTELISTLELHNTDSAATIAFKLKTTSPEKFRVKPSTGCLKPGAKDVVTVTLLPGFQLGGLSKDKFLVMSSILDEKEIASLDLLELWKNTGTRKVFQTRLRCVQSGEVTKNGNVVMNHTMTNGDNGDGQLSKMSSTLSKIADNQVALGTSLQRLQLIQIGQFVLTLVLGISIIYVVNSFSSATSSSNNNYCPGPNTP